MTLGLAVLLLAVALALLSLIALVLVGYIGLRASYHLQI